MKRFMAWIMMVLILSVSLAQAEDVFTYGPGVQFGMPMSAVRSAIGEKETEASEDALLYSGQKVAGKAAAILYLFENDALITIFIQFFPEHSNANDYIDDFTDVDDALVEKYGSGNYNSLYRWDNDLFKDDESRFGVAIASGDLDIASNWTVQDTLIFHLLTGDNYEVSHILRYAPTDYVPQTNTDGL